MEDPVKKDWGLRPLHKKMLQLLSYIHEFCTDNNIDYCLAYGSALGAIRHNGFIPWDDDVDIYMTAEGYSKFRSVFKEKGNHSLYYLQELGYSGDMVNFSKIRVNGTTFLEPITKNLDMHHGIYIDIFILHNSDGVKSHLKKMVFAGKYLTIKRLSNIGYSRRKSYNPILAFLRLFPYDFLRSKALKTIYQYDNQETDYYFEPEFQSKVEMWEKDIIFPAVQHKFEGMNLNVPAKCHDYLTMYYGDYMKIPTLAEIEWGHHSSEWYVDRDFKDILEREFSFKDEIIG